VVINEIMYHSRGATADESWIELFNRGTNTADLTDWKLDGGISFRFAPGTSILAGGYLVVTKNVEMLRRIGINTVALTPAELRDLQPDANVDDIGAAAYEPESGYANPADTVEGLRRRATELGAQIRQWTGVTKILRRESRVVGVETSAGRIDAGAVVVAAGAWAPRLCRDIGLEIPARAKGIDTVVVTRPTELAKPHMVFIDNVQGSYMRPESGILTIVGVPCQDWDLDPDGPLSLPSEAPSVGAQILTHRIPAMERATLARGYRAFDCYSPDRHAILGRVDGVDGLYLATAFSGSGFKIAPAVGMCMAELITEGRAKTVDIEAFSLRRFAEGKTVEGPYPYATRPDHKDPAASQLP
jgi:glycine/D-amino acid oxidase-like deaminating enzyme